jgi:hypothetical protein
MESTWPPRWKAIRRPSGDHAGSSALAGVPLGSILKPRPSAFTVASRPRVMNAIRRPSGDQSGEKLVRPLVSLRATAEAIVMTQI